MDLGILGTVTFDWSFVSAFLSIVLIDLILAGDNAVIIAMAVRSLPPVQRRKGIIFGAGAAVLLRVMLTFFISQLLQVNYLKLIGGALILWISVKLLIEGAPDESGEHQVSSLSQAIKLIVIADITMSVDNMLAVAGASHGSLLLLLFGLGLSIPFIVFTSGLLSMLMDKYPIIIYIGAGVLGKVGGEMMITDPVIFNYLNPSNMMIYGVEALFAAGVIVAGKLWLRFKARSHRQAASTGALDEGQELTES